MNLSKTNRTKTKFDYGKNSEVLVTPPNLEELDALQVKRRDLHERFVKAEQSLMVSSRDIKGNRMVTQGTCPCGKHRGVVFFQDEKQVSEGILCPVCVYLTWYRQAIREGRGRGFTEEKPFRNFVEQFHL